MSLSWSWVQLRFCLTVTSWEPLLVSKELVNAHCHVITFQKRYETLSTFLTVVQSLKRGSIDGLRNINFHSWYTYPLICFSAIIFYIRTMCTPLSNVWTVWLPTKGWKGLKKCTVLSRLHICAHGSFFLRSSKRSEIFRAFMPGPDVRKNCGQVIALITKKICSNMYEYLQCILPFIFHQDEGRFKYLVTNWKLRLLPWNRIHA